MHAYRIAVAVCSPAPAGYTLLTDTDNPSSIGQLAFPARYDVNAMATACNAQPGTCTGFNSYGWLKSNVFTGNAYSPQVCLYKKSAHKGYSPNARDVVGMPCGIVA